MTIEYQKYTLPMRRRFQARGRTVRNKKPILRGPQVRGLIGAAWNTKRQ